MTNAGLAERKGHSSCATSVTPDLLYVCKVRGGGGGEVWFLAPANLGRSKGHVTLRLSLGMWDVCDGTCVISGS